MGARSDIEWTDASWTPIRARNKATGAIGWHCTHKSDGCKFCYAEGINRRLGTGLDFKPVTERKVEIFLDKKMLRAPMHWRKPRMIFVCSMTDLFADFVPDGFISWMFGVMALAPQHTFQVLTKRPDRMRAWIEDRSRPDRMGEAVLSLGYRGPLECLRWPMRNVWLGFSAEDQDNFDARSAEMAPLAGVGWLTWCSAEPLLGPIALGSAAAWLKWVVVGGESGPKARPMLKLWAQDIRDECAETGLDFLFKQWGAWTPGENVTRQRGRVRTAERFDGRWLFDLENLAVNDGHVDDEPDLYRVGKKAAGRTLDGVIHDARPEVPA